MSAEFYQLRCPIFGRMDIFHAVDFFSGVSCRLKTPTVGEFLVRRNCRLSTVHTDWYGFYVAFVTWLWTVPWLFFNKNAWAFQWAYRSGEENTHIYIYIHIYICIYIYIYIPILFIHPRFFTQKLPIRFLFWMDFLFKKFAWLQPGKHVFFQPEALNIGICWVPRSQVLRSNLPRRLLHVWKPRNRKAVQGGFSMKKPELSGLSLEKRDRNGAD